MIRFLFGLVIFFSFPIMVFSEDDADRFAIVNPKDKDIVYTKKINVVGIFAQGEYKSVSCNGIALPIVNRKAQGEIPLALGRNVIRFDYVNAQGDVFTKAVRVLRRRYFQDIKGYFWAKQAIEDLGALGILTPYYDHAFVPQKLVERSEFAATLVKINKWDLPKKRKSIFRDVSLKYWGAPYIQLVVEKGLMSGMKKHYFMPTKPISKGDAVIGLLKFANIDFSGKIDTPPYADVPVTHNVAVALAVAKKYGLIKDALYFKPDDPLNRAELASMVAQLPKIKEKIDLLYNWEKYPMPKKRLVKARKAPQAKPKIESVTILPSMIPADSKTLGKVLVKVSHPDGIDKIVRVEVDCEPLGWGNDGKLFLYDDGKSYDDRKAKDGIFSGYILVFKGVKPGVHSVNLLVKDEYGHEEKSSFVINVVSNINGI